MVNRNCRQNGYAEFNAEVRPADVYGVHKIVHRDILSCDDEWFYPDRHSVHEDGNGANHVCKFRADLFKFHL